MLPLAGLGFEVEPEDALSPAEKRSLQALERIAGTEPPPRSFFHIRLVTGGIPGCGRLEDFPARTPALAEWADGLVRVTHRHFCCELDPLALTGRLHRGRSEAAFPLEVTLRVALASRLPLEGGLPLHAAGILTGGGGIAFFGPSGAGKSTLAGLSPHPVLSDELLAVTPGRPFDVTRTGFFGTLGLSNAPAGAFPLRALIELGRGPRFRLRRLSAREALRRLLGVILVPIGPPLWTAAIDVAGRLTAAVPAYRMEWSPASPPWDELEGALRSA